MIKLYLVMKNNRQHIKIFCKIITEIIKSCKILSIKYINFCSYMKRFNIYL